MGVAVAVGMAVPVGVVLAMARNLDVAEGVVVGDSVLVGASVPGQDVAVAGREVAAGGGVPVTSGVTGRMVSEGVGVRVGKAVDVHVDDGRGTLVFVGEGVGVGEGVLVGVGVSVEVGGTNDRLAATTWPVLWTAKTGWEPGVAQPAGMRMSAANSPFSPTSTGPGSSWGPSAPSQASRTEPGWGQHMPVTRTRKSCPATA